MKLPIDQIKENPANPRTISKEKYQKLLKSIKEFPKMLELRPLVIDKDGYVLGGNMRLKALTELGFTEVPIVRAEDLTEEETRRFIITDNLSFGEWDWDRLGNEWDAQELADWGLDGVPDSGEASVGGEMNFTAELLEENNYVCLVFNDLVDFNMIQDLFGLESVHSTDSKEGYERAGVGRVVDGKKLIKILNDYRNTQL